MKLKEILLQIIDEEIVSKKNILQHESEKYINGALILYHGSPYNFYKFTTSKMGSGSGKQMDGWGIYLTTSEESAKIYGKYIYEVTLKDKDLTLIDFGEPVKKVIVSKIVESVYKKYNKDFDINKFNSYYDYIKDNSLPKVDFNDFELVQFDYSGFLFYRTLSRLLGGDKQASLFLLSNGIDGLKNKGTYIIFDEQIINIENKYETQQRYA
jgi:hypothetical protein